MKRRSPSRPRVRSARSGRGGGAGLLPPAGFLLQIVSELFALDLCLAASSPPRAVCARLSPACPRPGVTGFLAVLPQINSSHGYQEGSRNRGCTQGTVNKAKMWGKHPCGRVPENQALSLYRLGHLIAAARLPFLRKPARLKATNAFPLLSPALPGPSGTPESITAGAWRKTQMTQPSLQARFAHNLCYEASAP